MNYNGIIFILVAPHTQYHNLIKYSSEPSPKCTCTMVFGIAATQWKQVSRSTNTSKLHHDCDPFLFLSFGWLLDWCKLVPPEWTAQNSSTPVQRALTGMLRSLHASLPSSLHHYFHSVHHHTGVLWCQRREGDEWAASSAHFGQSAISHGSHSPSLVSLFINAHAYFWSRSSAALAVDVDRSHHGSL